METDGDDETRVLQGSGAAALLADVGALLDDAGATLREHGLDGPDAGALLLAAGNQVDEAAGQAGSAALLRPGGWLALLEGWARARPRWPTETAGAPDAALAEGMKRAFERLDREAEADPLVFHNFLLDAAETGPVAAVLALARGARAQPRRGRKERPLVGGRRTSLAEVQGRLGAGDWGRALVSSTVTGAVAGLLRAALQGGGPTACLGTGVVWACGALVWRVCVRWRLRLGTVLVFGLVIGVAAVTGDFGRFFQDGGPLSAAVRDVLGTSTAHWAGVLLDTGLGFLRPLAAAVDRTGCRFLAGVAYDLVGLAVLRRAARLPVLDRRTALLAAAPVAVLVALATVPSLVGFVSLSVPGTTVTVLLLWALRACMQGGARLAGLDPGTTDADDTGAPVPVPSVRETLLPLSDTAPATPVTVGRNLREPEGSPVLALARCVALADGVRLEALRIAGC